MASKFICLIVAVVVETQLSSAFSQPVKPVASEKYPFNAQLDNDGNYFLFWRPNSTHITFEVHVKTRGYVGFGISHNGKMYPADVIVGWVKDGQVHFTDRHTTRHSEPTIDSSQNWTLIHGEENNFGTVLKFYRKLDLCDQDDIEITDDTMRIIYSYHPDDPLHETGLSWHGATRRGSKSLLLLSHVETPQLPHDAQTVDFLNNHYHVPSKGTTYHCRVFNFANLGKKHHVIKFEPVLQPGNEAHVHHILVYKCPAVDQKYIGSDYECYSANPGFLRPCGNSIFGWAVGGGPFYFPQNVGMPIAEPGDTDVYIMETHYDNPTVLSNIVDNSGIRLTYTPTLRHYDAGLLTTGLPSNGFHIIPPYEDAFVNQAFCTEDCLRKGLSHTNGQVKVFAAWQHAHLLGRKIRTRHIRNGVEIEPFAEDDHYDFDYQDTRMFRHEVILEAGDSIITECTYNSSHLNTVTFGGLSTHDEMCLAFLFYYPKMPLDGCKSHPIYDNVAHHEHIHSIVQQFDWKDSAHRKTAEDILLHTHHQETCYGHKLHPQRTTTTISRQIPKVAYTKPATNCSAKSSPAKSMMSSALPHTTSKPSIGKTTVPSKLQKNVSPSSSEHYPFHAQLDSQGNYLLYWKPNSTHITFEVHVKTRGYVGFGISHNGKMFPADVVIGWVKDGHVHFKDRHTTQHSEPSIDKSQDWILIHGEENDFGTILKFARKLDTCDADDIKITDDTARIIYSYHPDDPLHETGLTWHGATGRGSKSLLLLSHVETPRLPKDAQTIDFLNNHYHVPSKGTTYHSRIFSLANLGKKHHMIKFEPVIQQGNEAHVHHILVYKCPAVDHKYIGHDHECYSVHPSSLRPCGNTFFGWAVGGGPFYFPQDVGMPIAEPSDSDIYIMETHYDNPTLLSNIVDNSGMRITYTPTLRHYDAGLLTTGMHVNHFHIIPPYEEAFVNQAFCTEDCLRKGLSYTNGEVKVFAAWQHAHLLGTGIKTRHIRNGVEIEPFAEDDHYDFNYQETRMLRQEMTLKAGDSIITECTYNSSHLTKVTFGGLSTHDEMCLAFLFYYPRMPLDGCQSHPLYDTVHGHGSIQSYVQQLDWKDATNRQNAYKALLNTHHSETCFGHKLHPHRTTTTISRQIPKTTYTKPESNCSAKSGPAKTVLSSALPYTTSKPSFVKTAVPSSIPKKVPVASSEHYPFHSKLDRQGNYLLYWKPNSTHITFEVHVKTRGYVGFGISHNGKMFPADVVIGWVKDGHVHFKDRHTTQHSEPSIDKSQDWILIHGEENDFGTILKFARKLDTCDADDIKITDDTARIIYSYHPDDPLHETGLTWHGATRRGSKSLLLLSHVETPRLPQDAQTIDFLNNHYHVPSKGTTYHCRIFSLANLGKKHHMIKFEPVIQQGNEAHVHHILVYKCPAVDHKYIGHDHECYSVHPSSLRPCGNTFFGWAVGGGPFYFPQDVGMPIAEPSDSDIYIMETHYDNPTQLSNIVDNSGMRITYTPTLRHYDAGLLTTGLHVNHFHIIPPYEQALVNQAFCTEDCLRKGLSHTNGEVKVFAAWQHAHLLGTGIKTRHIRNGVEIKPFAEDDHYDFNYQETRMLRQEMTLKAGDSIITECTYNSSHLTTVTFGGLSTHDEMCLAFLFYYPRMPLDGCQSHPLYDTVHGHNNIQNYVEHLDWKDATNRQNAEKALFNTHHSETCFGHKLNPHRTTTKIPRQVPRVNYTAPASNCVKI